jgi:crotonobetainyl-CoA:carnitine CoA-transferase CaiB-like acyl-CoA transferase
MTAADRAAQPGLRERLVQLPVDGAPVKGYPLRFQKYRLPIRTHAPAIGEDTDAVLRDLLGFDTDTIERLRKDGVVYVEPLSAVVAH